MSRTLVIAEKPSVATDLARVLGKMPGVGKLEKKKDYFENEHLLVASAVGHLVELKMPTTDEGKKLPWGIKHLPVIPDQFQLQPIERTEARFKLLKRLLKQKDITTVVNACDAGREGELIFYYLIKHAAVKNDFEIKRMWMQSMTDGSITEAWNSMRPNEEMQPLADAAVCRSESDWLIGLNGTRALTAFNSRNGGFNVTTAGRVQTPTLMILAERERIIRAFVSRPYWEVHGEFEVAAGKYPGRWFAEDFKKDETDDQKKPERLWSAEEAEAIKARCEGKIGIVEEKKRPSKSAPPLLFDLTSLQREANSKHGFPANRTLQLAQACYDRHKILTYPRTDSKCLPEDYVDTVKETVANLAAGQSNSALGDDLKACAKWLITNDRIQPVKRVFNTKKVSDHFAIVPTGQLPPKNLDDGATKLYQLVLKRFLAIFYPSAEFEITNRLTRIGDDVFKTDGKVLIVPGYLEVYGRKPGVAAEKDELVKVDDGEDSKAVVVDALEKETRPPARYTDSTLLSAMETAGKRVDDDELREAMSERGLGTPATRAATIEGLIRQKYLFRNEIRKSELVVSNKGLALSDILETIGIEELGSPEMTGEWEYKLKAMEKGELDRKVFMDEIKSITSSIVQQTKDHIEVLVNRTFPDLKAKCPECGKMDHKQTDGLFQCKDPECIFKLKKHIASHELTEEEARILIEERKVGPIETFKNRFGQPFAAELTIDKPKKVWKVAFVFEGDEEREKEVDNLTDEQIICQCKLLDDGDELTAVYENAKAFLAPAMAKKKQERGVRISKTILQKEIPTEQGIKLFVEGKTELMPGFLSKKGRKFAAYLTLDRVSGKLGFEFAPRAAKKGKKGAKKDEGEVVEAGKTGDAADDGDVKVKVKKAATKKKTTTAKKSTKAKKATKKKVAKKATKKAKKKKTEEADD